MCSSYSFSFK
uniref:Uncharacterized protein n=1 Tax=Arundo donax TaxID=35708 RepID=A0A0A9BCF5_ARUDO